MPMLTKTLRPRGGAFILRTRAPLDFFLNAYKWANPETYPVVLEVGQAILGTVPLTPTSILNTSAFTANISQCVGFVAQRIKAAVGETIWVPYINCGQPYVAGGQPPIGCIINQADASPLTYGYHSGGITTVYSMARTGGLETSALNNSWTNAATRLGFTVINPPYVLASGGGEQPTILKADGTPVGRYGELDEGAAYEESIAGTTPVKQKDLEEATHEATKAAKKSH